MKILVTGINGQDGAWLAKDLIEQGHTVVGAVRRGATNNLGRLEYLNILNKIKLVPCDISEFGNVFNVLRKEKPDQIYNLAAQSFVAESFTSPLMTNKINYMGVFNLLESIRSLDLDCGFYQASSSEMFGEVQVSPQDENTNFYPMSPYGVSKVGAHHAVINYRKAYGIHGTTGILFNHESELRGEEFVTRKITSQMAQLANGREAPIELGNLDAKRDWGYAPDYMKAVQTIMNADVPNDYVVSTNRVASIRDFFKASAEVAGYKAVFEGEGLFEKCVDSKTGKLLCVVNKDFYRPSDVVYLQGDSKKIENELGWKASVYHDELAIKMTEFDLDRVQNPKNYRF